MCLGSVDSFLYYNYQKHLYDALLQVGVQNFKIDQPDIDKTIDSIREGILSSGGTRQGETAWRVARVNE